MNARHAAIEAEAVPRVPDLVDLRAQLQAALLAGGDTAAIRSQIQAAEAAERRRQATEIRAAEMYQRRVAADRADTLARATTALVRPTLDRLEAQLAALAPPPENPIPPALKKGDSL